MDQRARGQVGDEIAARPEGSSYGVRGTRRSRRHHGDGVTHSGAASEEAATLHGNREMAGVGSNPCHLMNETAIMEHVSWGSSVRKMVSAGKHVLEHRFGAIERLRHKTVFPVLITTSQS